MKRTATTIAVLVGVLLVPAGAEAQQIEVDAGFNQPTRRLEASFTAALTARINSNNGCYPRVPQLVKKLDKRKAVGEIRSAKNLGSARVVGIVYVLRKGTSCNGVQFSLRFKKVVYLLDSLKGEIRIVGRKRKGPDPAVVANRGPLRSVRLVTRNQKITQPNNRVRLEAKCPGKTLPIGGGMVPSPGLQPNGDGVYPHSYERLGAQRGFHVTGWYFRSDGVDKGTWNVGIQALCGLGLAPLSAPHATTFTRPGEYKTVVARCPAGQYLLSGGFQRTDFLSPGGNYVTENRALSPQAWLVSGRAFGEFGGELTAIAYCTKASGPLLTEVSSQSVPVSFFGTASTTTAPCPAGKIMSIGGFSTNGKQDTWSTGGRISGGDDTWTVEGFGRLGSTDALTAYGYCLTPGV